MAAVVPLAAQTGVHQPHEANWKPVCEKAKTIALPAVKYTHDEAWLKSCDSKTLYYGYAGKPDYAAARECGFYQREHANPGNGDPFAGTGVLTMIYANGDGVARNYDLAMRFACENSWSAPAEMEFRIGHLEERETSSGSTKKFDLCDDATSGLMQGACEDVTQSFANAKRKRDLEAFVAAQHWNSNTQDLFQQLQAAEKEFEETRTRFEVDASGTGRAAFELEEQGRLRDQFLITLHRFAKNDVPAAGGDEVEQIHGEVRQALDKVQKTPASTWQYTTVKPAGINKTQAAYEKLEETWGEFARAAFPSLTTEQVRAQLDRLRLHQLKSAMRT